MFLALVVLILGTAAVYAGTVWNSTTNTLKSTYTNLGNNSTLTADKPLTILLMGVDTGDASRGGATSWDGNSDSQIVMTLNPKTKTATMVSLERDTMTNIIDNKGNIVSQQKMNAAYPSGYNAGGLNDAALYAMSTIGQQAGIPINNFVAINMDGLVSLVNDVGGISVVNDSGGNDAYQGTSEGQQIQLPTGETVDSGAIYISNTEPAYTAYVPYYSDHREQTLNGEQALVFARDRDTLANGDYGRAAHQREVLSQLAKKLVNLNNISQYQKFLNDISGDIKTNIAIDATNLPKLIAYKDCFNKVVSIQYQGVGETAAGSDGASASYQFMPQEVDLAVQNAMLRSIGSSTISSLNSNIITYESYFNTTPASYYLPSATVTEGKKTTTYGVDSKGNFVSLNSGNASNYVSATGGSVGDSSNSSSNSSSPSSSSQ